ncbi:hypothetical protein [Streptomyces sp. NPDC006267]|uniref:hypothetical protein n=1 Tax=Streptomyces sp. NPDC006267 TaxID=3157173 RepID=UPI0033B92D92
MNAKRVSAVAGVIYAAQKVRSTATGIATALEAAGLLQSPESAAELVVLRGQGARLEQHLDTAIAGFNASAMRIAELEAQHAAVLALHRKHTDSEHCHADDETWPCNTRTALGRPAPEPSSPWERAVAGLNALVDADVIFHVEPDGHISAPFSDEHIEWDLKAKRWVLTHDGDDDSYEAAADRYLATPYTDDNPRPIPDTEHLAVVAARWNSLYPVGTPVTAYPGCRPEDDPKDERLVTRTRSAASVLGGHTAVVWVEGHGACIKLTHVDARPGGAA